jgi:glycosyltransferase involved in cell wall biosynthesis
MSTDDSRKAASDGLPSTQTAGVKVSVVIPVLNGASTIGMQLDALITQEVPQRFEIIVADNGSTDETRDIVARYMGRAPEVLIVDASHRRGINVGRNAGLRVARGEKVLFCDADDIVAPGWVRAMARALDVGDGVGGVIEYRRLNSHLQHLPPQSAVFREGPTPVPLGACCGWRRSLLLRLGGYDESWLVGGDDIEFALRAARAGARVVEAPDAVLHKRERASRRDLARQYYKFGRSRPRLIKVFPDLAERRSTSTAARQWGWLLLQMMRGRATHKNVLRIAHNLGRIVGSLEHRSWAP